MKDLFLGLDNGGTKYSDVIGDTSFSVLQKVGFDTNTDRGWKSILPEFTGHIKNLHDTYPQLLSARSEITSVTESLIKCYQEG
jgi:hypothetical protein